MRGVYVTKIIGGKLAKPLPRFAVGKAVGQPLCSQTGRDAKLRPNRILTEVVKASRVCQAEFRVFAQAGSQPGGSTFGGTYTDKIDLDIVFVHSRFDCAAAGAEPWFVRQCATNLSH